MFQQEQMNTISNLDFWQNLCNEANNSYSSNKIRNRHNDHGLSKFRGLYFGVYTAWFFIQKSTDCYYIFDISILAENLTSCLITTVPKVLSKLRRNFFSNCRPLFFGVFKKLDINDANFPFSFRLPFLRSKHGLRTSRESFFSNFWAWAEILRLKCFEAFVVFSAGLSAPILVL